MILQEIPLPIKHLSKHGRKWKDDDNDHNNEEEKNGMMMIIVHLILLPLKVNGRVWVPAKRIMMMAMMIRVEG